MPEDDIRVTNPDVGGGFGMKGMDYPEYFSIAAAAREAFMSGFSSGSLVAAAATAAGAVLALRWLPARAR